MKIKNLVILAAAALCLCASVVVSHASITWAGTPLTVVANSTTNLNSTLVPIGTLTMNRPTLFVQTYGNNTNTFVNGRLTFDGTNFFTIPQTYASPGYPTNQPVLLTNFTFTVYASLSISNGASTNITINITSP